VEREKSPKIINPINLERSKKSDFAGSGKKKKGKEEVWEMKNIYIL